MSQKKTILIVDDEPRYVKLVEINLQTEGYQVRTASNGQQRRWKRWPAISPILFCST